MTNSEILNKIFQIIRKNNLKISVYATVSIFFRKIESHLRSEENNLTESEILIENYFNNPENYIFILALLSLACKANDFEMSSKIIHDVLSENKENQSETARQQSEKDSAQETSHKDSINFIEFRKKIDSCEAFIPLVFNYDLHIPCPFIRILGLIICLNEQGKIFQDQSDTKKKEIETHGTKQNVDMLFQRSTENLIQILLDQNVLNYTTNELAFSSIPLDLDLFKGLTMNENVNHSNIAEIREKNKIKLKNVKN